MAPLTSPGKQGPYEHSIFPLTTSADFHKRLQAVQRGIAQRYRENTTNVSNASGEPNSAAAVSQYPEPSITASSQLHSESQIEIDVNSDQFNTIHGATHRSGNYFFP
jgi:hypothetical protein